MDLNELKKLIDEAKAKGDLAAVARIMEMHADMLADEALRIADAHGHDDAKVANRVAVRQWAAERMQRKAYSVRGEINVRQTLDIDACLAAARKRMVDAAAVRTSIWQRLWDGIRGRR